MTTIQFDARAATAEGRATPITIDGTTVYVSREQTTEVGAWHVEIDADGRATLTGGSKFQNNVAGDIGNVVQLGNVDNLTI